MSKLLKILLLGVGILLLVVGAYQAGNNRVANQKREPNFFTSSEYPWGGYSFNYPRQWIASLALEDSRNTRFGPAATTSMGLGGVEVFENQNSIDDFLKDNATTDKRQVTVSGMPAVRYQFSNAETGEAVLILKEGTLYRIYINSTKPKDIQLFDQVVESFEIFDKYIPSESPISNLGITQRIPEGTIRGEVEENKIVHQVLSEISFVFSGTPDPSTITNSSIYVLQGIDEKVPATLHYDQSNKKVTLHFASPRIPNDQLQRLTIVIDGVKDSSGLELDQFVYNIDLKK